MMKPGLYIFFISNSFILIPGILKAQESFTQKEVWPQLDAYYRINTKFRLYGMWSATRSNSQQTDGTAGIYIDGFAKPWARGRTNETEMNSADRGYYWWFRTGYSYSDAPSYEKKKVVNIFETEINDNFHLPYKIVMILRNRLDTRWVNSVFLPIYRPRLKIVRNFKTEYLTFNAYTYGEYFFDLNQNTQNKFRWCIGTEIKVLQSLSFEVYYLYQFPNGNAVPSVNAIGLQFNLYYSSKKYKMETSVKPAN